jgi:hypothetical protein
VKLAAAFYSVLFFTGIVSTGLALVAVADGVWPVAVLLLALSAAISLYLGRGG